MNLAHNLFILLTKIKVGQPFPKKCCVTSFINAPYLLTTHFPKHAPWFRSKSGVANLFGWLAKILNKKSQRDKMSTFK